MNIKKYILPLCILVMVFGITACKKNNGFNTVVSEDKTKPEPVSNIKVDDFNGGSYITYDLPKSENILYVLAKYKINEHNARETKASYYIDTVLVNGFEKEQAYEVTLYTVTRANIMSDPITVTVNPKTPVFKLVRPTLTLLPDFSGVNLTGTNPTKQEIGIIMLSYNDNTKTMEIYDQYFTKDENIDYSIRGFKSEERDFGVYVTDKWGNISDTLKKSLTPLFEEAVNKNNFFDLAYASDSPIDFGWTVPYLWDGKADGNGWHTRFGILPPYVVSFGIGKTYKLSRFVLHERIGSEYTYNYGNPKEFSLWGSNVASPKDQQLPLKAEEGAVLGDWINLGNFRFPDPPSGNRPGSTSAADEDFVKKGVSFKVPFQAPSVKFLRISIATNWGNVAAAHIMEFTPYGLPE